MGTTRDSKKAGSVPPPSFQQWREIRAQSMRAAVRWGGSRQPDDDVQEAILRTLETEARGACIQDYRKYVSSAGIKVAHSEQRRRRVVAKHTLFLTEHPNLWIAEEPTPQEESYCQSIPGLRQVAREIETCLADFINPELIVDYLFSKLYFCENFPLYDSLKEESPCPRSLNAIFKKLKLALQLRDISYKDLFAVLRTPAAVIPHSKLTLLVARWAANNIERLQNSSKKCRLDILYRTRLDRQDLYLPKLSLFSDNLDAAYRAAHIPREYSLIGATYYLEKILKIEPKYRNLTNSNYVEFLILDVIRNKLNMNPIDRWLAIVMLGVLYGQENVDSEYAEKILLPVEQTAQQHTIQKIGMAFAWVNAIKDSQQRVIREKVYPLLKSELFPGGLSQLPITVIGAYMGSGAETLIQALADYRTWHPILLGLQSTSYLANLGALAQLSHMPYHKPPAAIREELTEALRKVEASPIALICQRAGLVPRQYKDDNEELGD